MLLYIQVAQPGRNYTLTLLHCLYLLILYSSDIIEANSGYRQETQFSHQQMCPQLILIPYPYTDKWQENLVRGSIDLENINKIMHKVSNSNKIFVHFHSKLPDSIIPAINIIWCDACSFSLLTIVYYDNNVYNKLSK